MIKSSVLFAALVGLGLAACTDSKNRIAHDGQFFRAKVTKVDKQRDVFVVSVKDPSKSVEGARAAALHEATSYCLDNYGTSAIDWQVDPTDEAVQLTATDGWVSFQGRCPQAQSS